MIRIREKDSLNKSIKKLFLYKIRKERFDFEKHLKKKLKSLKHIVIKLKKKKKK